MRSVESPNGQLVENEQASSRKYIPAHPTTRPGLEILYVYTYIKG